MEFQKYIDNLTNQLQLVNADIVEKQEELDKLKEFRSRIKGGMEVVKQIQTDLAEESTPLPLQQEIQQSIQELTQGRHGGDFDAL